MEGLKTVVSAPSRRAETAYSGERTERDDEGWQAQQRNQAAIDDAETEAREDRDRQPKRAKLGQLGDRQPGHRGRGQDRPHRQVDAAGEDDEGHACGEHGVDRGLLKDDAEILSREEAAVGQIVKARAQQQQHRQHAGGADQEPYALTPGLLRGCEARSRGLCLRRSIMHRAAPCRSRVP